jgi:hypothetical protein
MLRRCFAGYPLGQVFCNEGNSVGCPAEYETDSPSP